MSDDQNNIQNYAILVTKMVQKVQGTDMEPIWRRLDDLMSRISSLTDSQRSAIDSTMKALIEKIEHFNMISQNKLNPTTSPKNEPYVPHMSSFTPNPSTLSEEVHFAQPVRPVTKRRTRWGSKNRRFIMMSPRHDSTIPKLRIKLSAISQLKKKKEEKRKLKKSKQTLQQQTSNGNYNKNVETIHPENGTSQADTSSEQPNKISVKSENLNKSLIPMECDPPMNVASPINPLPVTDKTVTIAPKIAQKTCDKELNDSTVSLSNIDDSVNIPTASKVEKLNKIPIERSKSNTVNPHEDSGEVICLDDSDTETNQNEPQKVTQEVSNDKKSLGENVDMSMSNSSQSINGQQETEVLTTIKTVNLLIKNGEITLRRSQRNSVNERNVQIPQMSQKPIKDQQVINSLPKKPVQKPKRILQNARKSLKSSTSSQSSTKTIQKQPDNNQPGPTSSTSTNVLIRPDLERVKHEPGYQSPPMTEIPIPNVVKNLSKNKKLVLLSPETTLNKIRPWIQKSAHRKYLKNCEEMLSGFCLEALYKCMGSTCSYYTKDDQLFTKHLERHKKYQINDLKNFSACAYCQFNNDNSQELVNHITNTHGNNRYQCSYCFYRSYEFQIHMHHQLYHTQKSESVIECTPLKTVNLSEELSAVWKNFYSVCRPIICCVCKGKFFNIKQYEKHFKKYSKIPSTKCIKCGYFVTQETSVDHLKGCHGFGDYSCSFCNFGTDSIETMKIHLSSHHYDKPMLYFDRSLDIENSETPKMGALRKQDISKLLVLKQMLQQQPATMKIIKIFQTFVENQNFNNINGNLIQILNKK